MPADPLDLRVDDDGFVCLVAPDSYEGFVAEDWTLEPLLARFAQQMNRESLFIAYPGPEAADSQVDLESTPSAKPEGREASGIVRVGASGLWFTDYSQLTMAAQYSDEQPTASYSHRLPLDPGRYRITLTERPSDDEPSFVLSVSPADAAALVEHDAVPWFDSSLLD